MRTLHVIGMAAAVTILGWAAACKKDAAGPSEGAPPSAPSQPAESAPNELEEASPAPAASVRNAGSVTPEEGLELEEERWPDGTLKTQKYVRRSADGSPVIHGPYRSWYENGQLRARGDFVDGIREGAWSYWHSNGQLSGEGALRNDRADGPWTYWHDNGQKAKEQHWKVGLAHGPYRSWFQDGQQAEEGHFVDGQPHGVFRAWDPEGNPLGSTTYEHGIRVESADGSPTVGRPPAASPAVTPPPDSANDD